MVGRQHPCADQLNRTYLGILRCGDATARTDASPASHVRPSPLGWTSLTDTTDGTKVDIAVGRRSAPVCVICH